MIRLSLCGPLSVSIDKTVLTRKLPGKQGRLLLAILAYERRPLTKNALIRTIWPSRAPTNPAADLAALLSKLKRVLGAEHICTKGEIRLSVPSDTWIDTEVAKEKLHTAESYLAQERWQDAWIASQVSSHILARVFLQGIDNSWSNLIRNDLGTLRERALSCLATTGLMIGGSELPTSERAARALIEINPYREESWRLLMRCLAALGNKAEAIWQYRKLEELLRNELDITPSKNTIDALDRIKKL